MCNLMGREPSQELVDRVCLRYLTIGGSSPIIGIAKEIAAGLESRLVEAGHDVPVRVGMRYWDPYIDDALAELKSLGCDRVITISLSPFESKVTSGAYQTAVAAAAEDLGGIELVEAPLISEMPEFVTFLAGSTAAGHHGHRAQRRRHRRVHGAQSAGVGSGRERPVRGRSRAGRPGCRIRAGDGRRCSRLGGIRTARHRDVRFADRSEGLVPCVPVQGRQARCVARPGSRVGHRCRSGVRGIGTWPCARSGS